MIVNIEDAVYINLEERIDRKKHIEKLFRGASWKVRRLPAIKLDGSPEANGLKMKPRLNGHTGVASIWSSHRSALNSFAGKMGSENGGCYVIFEDDVRINDKKYFDNPVVFSDGISEGWEIIFVSPRFRWKDKALAPEYDKGNYFARPPTRSVWMDLNDLCATYIVTGAHFVIIRDRKVARKICEKMSSVSVYDVDNFYVDHFACFGINDEAVSAGGFGSDHNNFK